MQSGPEYLSILDGTTGQPITRVAWPSREPFDTYNTASRNQICVAYLDGKTPCLIVERGITDDVIFNPQNAYTKRLLADVPDLKGSLKKRTH